VDGQKNSADENELTAMMLTLNWLSFWNEMQRKIFEGYPLGRNLSKISKASTVCLGPNPILETMMTVLVLLQELWSI